ncbi:Carboxypeptidase regulatory-like domain-containing protein [Sinomicrobium oceani]|uniref:Carboxypeptidase regulatory-like domain-containing protein n=1 Tax=Sinomicrobium oceani TaxID=1150368 RepID=A0A1K1S047_9FLAO|nr:carboxypeptidase-like regulatory domain-containing protein [Sinomicrobium oceani]SFW77453.1 Carboxypeptidase regulatory-like domain-containing protein [Sinomicrobium oceani]
MPIIKRYCSFLFYILFCITGSSQTIINGEITDQNGIFLSSANVTASEIENTTVLSYAITDNEGQYTLKINSTLDTLQIRVSYLGYAAEEKVVPNQNQILNFELSETDIELKEVQVKALPIHQKGDTIHYAVNAFKDQKDRSISDVLKKLPGIEVEANGRILYQGSPIQKYYIEGLDLLGGKYHLANENLPADAVSGIQILENHQPVKILDSLVFSDRASLNIKLKNNITVTGTAQAGIGFSPLLWDINLTPMLFTKKQQMITSYQTNNTGNDVSRQLEELTIEDILEDREDRSVHKEWTGIQQLSTPSFSERLWRDNNIHLLGTNYLTRLKKDIELKTNVSYLNDYQQQTGNTFTRIFIPGDTIKILENTSNDLFLNSLQGKFSLTKNTKKEYLKNDLELTHRWNAQRGFIEGNDSHILQEAKIPFSSIHNKLQWIIPIGKQLVTFNSVLNYTESNQKLEVIPGQFENLLNNHIAFDSIAQDVYERGFYTHNSVSIIKGYKKFTFTPKVGILLRNQNLNSRIYTVDNQEALANSFQNNLDFYQSSMYASLSTEYKNKSWKVRFSMPFKLQSFHAKDAPLDEKQKINRFTFNPRLSLTNDLTAFWKTTFSAGVENQFGSMDQLYYGYILTNYRNIRRYNSPIAERLRQNYRMLLRYRNPLISLFAHASYSFAHVKNNFLFDYTYEEGGTTIVETLIKDNYTTIHDMNFRGSKYFSEIKTTISAEASTSFQKRNQVLNGVLSEVRNQFIRIGMKTNTEITDWLTTEYKNSLSFIYTNWEGQAFDQIKNQEHHIDLNIFPAKNQYLGINSEFYHNNISPKNRSNYFLHLLYRYTIVNKKIDIEANWYNVLNTKEFTNVFNSGTSYVQSTYNLRPSQFILKVSFSF